MPGYKPNEAEAWVAGLVFGAMERVLIGENFKAETGVECRGPIIDDDGDHTAEYLLTVRTHAGDERRVVLYAREVHDGVPLDGTPRGPSWGPGPVPPGPGSGRSGVDAGLT
jgi:hypothetical protein